LLYETADVGDTGAALVNFKEESERLASVAMLILTSKALARLAVFYWLVRAESHRRRRLVGTMELSNSLGMLHPSIVRHQSRFPYRIKVSSSPTSAPDSGSTRTPR
jgi:hypothetical protein